MKTILVLEDELANAEVWRLILEEEGYRVRCVSSGRRGVARVAEMRPDLVVLHLGVPGAHAADLGRALRASPATRHIKILVNSNLPEKEVQAHFGQYDRFLRKPYHIDAALQAVAELLHD